MPSAATLDVRDLRMGFSTPAGLIVAVEDVTLSIGKGEVLAIIGESGSGKTVTAMAIARLLPVPPARYLEGSVRMGEAQLLALSEREMEEVRGRRIGTIFQNPRASLDPSVTIGAQLVETLRRHGFDDEDAWDIAGIAAYFGHSTRLANVYKVRANAEFYAMGR